MIQTAFGKVSGTGILFLNRFGCCSKADARTDAVIGTADTYLGGNANTSLAASAQFAWGGPTLTIPAGTKAGIYYVGILVDRTNASAESNESNNYVSRQITVYTLQ